MSWTGILKGEYIDFCSNTIIIYTCAERNSSFILHLTIASEIVIVIYVRPES